MSEPNEGPAARARAWRVLLDLRWPVFAVVATVGVFAFIVSYSHIYDLGRAHAQNGTAARLLPLSVDGLIVAATMVMFIRAGHGRAPDWRARWMPRLTLYAAIAATVLANVAYGLPSGWLSAVLSGWPGGAFVAAVELGIIVVRLAPQTAKEIAVPAAVPAARAQVPASAAEAAAMAYAASVAGGNPLPARQLVARYGITRSQADKIVRPPADRGQGGTSAVPPAARSTAPALATQQPPAGAVPEGSQPAPAGAALNGDGPHG